MALPFADVYVDNILPALARLSASQGSIFFMHGAAFNLLKNVYNNLPCEITSHICNFGVQHCEYIGLCVNIIRISIGLERSYKGPWLDCLV